MKLEKETKVEITYYITHNANGSFSTWISILNLETDKKIFMYCGDYESLESARDEIEKKLSLIEIGLHTAGILFKTFFGDNKDLPTGIDEDFILYF